MKKIILSILVVAAISFTSCKNDAKKEVKTIDSTVSKEMATTDVSFGVRGNCGMCKNTIEKAAKSVKAVTSVTWNVDKKRIDVTYYNKRATAKTIHNAIAASGYDTDQVAGNEDAYNNLPGCCKYDHEMEMNQSKEIEEDHSSHKH